MYPIKINVQLNFKSYLLLSYYLTYSRFVTVLLTLIGLFIFFSSAIWVVLGWFDILEMPPSPVGILIGFALAFATPIAVYFQVKKLFNSNKMLQEPMIYEFTKEQINIQGSSFSSTLSWSKIYEVKDVAGWILIYHDRLIANSIPKKFFTETQFSDFKLMVQSVPGLKSNLK